MLRSCGERPCKEGHVKVALLSFFGGLESPVGGDG
jgi:hypothetical protein